MIYSFLGLFIHRILNAIQKKYSNCFLLYWMESTLILLHCMNFFDFRYVLIEKTCLRYALDPFSNNNMICGKILLAYHFLQSFHGQYHYVSVSKPKCFCSVCFCSIPFNYPQFCPAQFYSVPLYSVLDIPFFYIYFVLFPTLFTLWLGHYA